MKISLWTYTCEGASLLGSTMVLGVNVLVAHGPLQEWVESGTQGVDCQINTDAHFNMTGKRNSQKTRNVESMVSHFESLCYLIVWVRAPLV